MSNLIPTNNHSLSSVTNKMLSDHDFEHFGQRVSREHRVCITFMLDQSGSMRESWGADLSKTKADVVAQYVNETLHELINICQKTESEPRHYFDICILGYGNGTEPSILWEGDLQGKTFVSPGDLKKSTTKHTVTVEKEFNIRGVLKKKSIPMSYWFTGVAAGLTPMGKTFDIVNSILGKWCDENQSANPPIVINITDGIQSDCTDEELKEKAFNLKALSTMYGNAVLFNLHIAMTEDTQVVFPSSENDLPNSKYCHLLYNMSSVLPTVFKQRVAAEIKGTDLQEGEEYVAMTYQGNINNITKALDIGTRTVKA